MSLDTLLAAVEAEADAEASALLADARAQADALMAEASAAVQAARDRAYATAAAEVRRARARLQTEAQLRIATLKGEASDSLVGQAFTRARAVLDSARSSPNYSLALRALLAETLTEFEPGEPLSIRCDPRDLPIVQELSSSFGRSQSVDPSLSCCGGIVVDGSSGRVVADNTLDRRLEGARKLLWPQVAVRLVENASPREAGALAGGLQRFTTADE